MKDFIIARIYEPTATKISNAAVNGNRAFNREVMATLEKAYPACRANAKKPRKRKGDPEPLGENNSFVKMLMRRHAVAKQQGIEARKSGKRCSSPYGCSSPDNKLACAWVSGWKSAQSERKGK